MPTAAKNELKARASFFANVIGHQKTLTVRFEPFLSISQKSMSKC